MTAGEKSVRVIDLFPMRFPDGQITYGAWPQAGAALIVQAVARVAAMKPEKKLLLCGCGLVLFFLALSGDRHAKRRHERR